jgi:VWFA-related protein
MMEICKKTFWIFLILVCTSQIIPAETPRVWFGSPQSDDIWIGMKKIEVRLRNIDLKKIHSIEIYLDGKCLKEFKSPPFTMTYDFGKVPKNRSLLVLVKDTNKIIILEQQIYSYQFDDARIVDVDQVVVPVVVTDQDGYYIKDLNKDDFIITEEDVIQEITYFAKKGKTKFNLALLMDISSSMKDKIGDVKDAAKIFLEALISKNDRAIIVMFNHEVFEDTDFTNNIDELVNSLSIAFPFGATALYDAIAYSIKLFRGTPGRNIIILFSDGEDNSSYIDPYTLIKKVEQSNCVIYSIGKKTAFFDDIRYQDILKNISVSSGGITFLFDDVSDIPSIYREIRRDIRAKYILQFKPKKKGKLKRFRKISIRVKGKKRYQIRTIKGYYY